VQSINCLVYTSPVVGPYPHPDYTPLPSTQTHVIYFRLVEDAIGMMETFSCPHNWIASGQFLKGIGKPLGNAQITPTSQYERRETCPAAIDKNMAILSLFSEESRFCLHLSKVKETVENFENALRFFSYFYSFS
jgi:hypothetical protein